MYTVSRVGAVRRIGSLIIGVVLIVVVAIVAFGGDGETSHDQNGQGQNGQSQNGQDRTQTCKLDQPLTEVRGLIGSEKEAFFNDERVRREFACAGLSITVDTTGSREMPAALSRNQYAFAFPSSSPTAQKIMDERAVT